MESLSPSPTAAPWLELFEKEKVSLLFPKMANQGITAFRESGFPDTGNEEWKYSSVLPMLKMGIPPALHPTQSSLDTEAIQAFIPASLDCHRMVFVNGFWDDKRSDLSQLPSGIQAGSLNSWLQQNPKDIELLGTLASPEKEGFSALSAAFFRDGAHIRVKAGTAVDKPLVVLWLFDTLGGNLSWNVRNLYRIEKGASATILHLYGFLGEGCGLGNMVNEVFVDENAGLHFQQVQTAKHPGWLIERTEIAQSRDSRSECLNFSGGPAFTRNNLHIRLRGENSETKLWGLYLGAEKRHIDNHTLVDHQVPNCLSDELYKGVLGGSSTAVFNGKVFVQKGAQKTNAFQSNRNLLLSDTATVNTKPQLEIFADDVKCSHGATTGQVDEEALFYLRSRGIGLQDAKKLLTLAFAGEIVEKLAHPSLHDDLEHLIHTTLEWQA